jgi:asparagine synthase (glutamine-hydrolysing)
MCGINGIFAYHSASGRPDECELLASREAMRSRGPDGAGSWWNKDRKCGLAHRRLSIIDLSDRALQPMTSEDRRLVVVFNGEIYNYRQLRSQLESEGASFRTTSDTEILLQLYSHYGRDMVHGLRGMYAFAIWDELRRGLLLARDPYGIKPLYTANDGWTFRFASQVKALLAGRRVSRDPEPAGIVGFHLFGNVPEPFTFYREIRALPAGHTQWIDGSGPREPKVFANLAEVMAKGVDNQLPPAELPERVRTGVQDSVRAHLASDVEVGIFLSAGVDSAALLGLMRDATQDEIRAITLSFDEFHGTMDDELPGAARVANLYGARHVVRRLRAEEFFEDLPRIFESMDQPSIDGVNTWFIAKAAKELGLKVVLSGLGGDELLGGYDSFKDLPRWRRRFGPLAAIPGLGLISRKLMCAMASSLLVSRPKAVGILEFSGSLAGTYLLRRGLFLPHELPAMLGEEMAREGLRRLDPVRAIEASVTPDPNTDAGRVSVLESTNYLRNQLLRDSDWAGMAHSIEIRVPLVDFKLFAQLAPAIGHLEPGIGKRLLAMAPSRPLPERVSARVKSGFSVPTGKWMNMATNVAVEAGEGSTTRGLVSRRWSKTVVKAMAEQTFGTEVYAT